MQRPSRLTHAVLLSCTAMPLFAQDMLLDPIVVEGDPEAVTEGQDRYGWQRVTVGGKQPQETQDIPQTVTVLSRTVLDDAGASSMEEASRLLPSLSEATGDSFVGSLYTRGQEVFQYYVDGAPRPYLSLYGTAPDLVFFDRLEVMSGPSGVFQGSGEPVGTINLVRKRPTDELQVQGSVSTDSEGSVRLDLDAGGPLNAAGTVRGRVVAYTDQQESFIDFAERDATGLSGTLDVDLGDRTTVSVGGIYEDMDTVRFSGLPTFADGTLLDDLDRSTFIGSSENEAPITNSEYYLEVEHTFDYGGVLKAMARQFNNDADLRNLLGSTPVDAATGDFNVFWFARDREEQTTYYDINLTSPLAVAGRAVELVVGADYRKTEDDFNQKFFPFLPVANINTFDPEAYPLPVFDFTVPGPGFSVQDLELEEFGLYAQARIDVTDQLGVNVGGRYTDYSVSNVGTGRGGPFELDNSETNFAPYLGLTYDLTQDLTAYASYATIFQPQTETDANGEVIKPRQGQQFEVGLKYVTPDGLLTAQGSYFHIRDENRAEADPNNVGAFTATDTANTQGVELLLSGEVFPQVEVIAGYSYVDTELDTDPTPPQNLSIFGKYTFDGGALEGLSLGAGVRAASDFEIEREVTIEADGYAVVDAFAAYEINDTASVRLGITNLFDTTYVERINTTARGTYFGDPLTASLTLSAKF
ncbi:MAG: TonB-dependent siderophore receptor [Pseudomonadota bacterium]